MKKYKTSPSVCGVSIVHYLEDHDIRQADLAAALCLSESVISRKLRNITRITLAEYIAICAFLDVPADYFLPDTQSLEVKLKYKHPCEEVIE